MTDRLPNYEEIARLEAQLAKERAVAASFDSLSERQKLATYLHTKTCRLPHADQCGWFYESWEDGKRSATRARYLSYADKLTAEGFSFSDVTRFLDILYGGR